MRNFLTVLLTIVTLLTTVYAENEDDHSDLNTQFFVFKNDNGPLRNPVPGVKYKIVREDGEIFCGVSNYKGETIKVDRGE